MAIVEVTKDNFDEVVNNNDVVILDFWAEWCGPCKTFAPVFEATSEKYPDVVFGKGNTEDQGELAGSRPGRFVDDQVDEPREREHVGQVEEQLDRVGCEVFGAVRNDDALHGRDARSAGPRTAALSARLRA